jgi:hypothetical protein
VGDEGLEASASVVKSIEIQASAERSGVQSGVLSDLPHCGMHRKLRERVLPAM